MNTERHTIGMRLHMALFYRTQAWASVEEQQKYAGVIDYWYDRFELIEDEI